jgi:hypothetical protein
MPVVDVLRVLLRPTAWGSSMWGLRAIQRGCARPLSSRSQWPVGAASNLVRRGPTDPLYADDRNFYKVELWTKDDQRVTRVWTHNLIQ